MVEYREIEKKYVLPSGTTLEEATNVLLHLFPNSNDLYLDIEDKFFVGMNASFVRLRNELNYDTSTITLKKEDQNNIINRLEINVDVHDSADAEAFLTSLYGPPAISFTTQSVVFYQPNMPVVCVYQVENDERIFLEVEGESEELIDEMVSFIETAFDLTQVNHSLFDIMRNKHG